MNEELRYDEVEDGVAAAHEAGAEVYKRGRRVVATHEGALFYLQGGPGERRWARMSLVAAPVPTV